MATNRPMCELHMVSLLAAVRAAGGAAVASMSAGMPPYSVTSARVGWGRNRVFNWVENTSFNNFCLAEYFILQKPLCCLYLICKKLHAYLKCR